MSTDRPLESPLESNSDNHLSNTNILTLTELACLARTSREMVEALIEMDLIEPCVLEPEIAFTVETLPMVRKMVRLHIQLDVNISSLALVMDLLDRIDYLEKRLADMETKETRDSTGSLSDEETTEVNT